MCGLCGSVTGICGKNFINEKQEKELAKFLKEEVYQMPVDKKANKNFAEIKAGDNLMVWYDMMTMSLPARTNANKVVIL